MRFLTALTEELQSGSEELAAFNAQQHRMWHAHVGDLPYERINGIPCMVITDERSTVPFTLVTEFPDETVQGPAFQLAPTPRRCAPCSPRRASTGRACWLRPQATTSAASTRRARWST
jgi:hypothetical protein